jgi:hypothetical protein
MARLDGISLTDWSLSAMASSSIASLRRSLSSRHTRDIEMNWPNLNAVS